MNDDAYRVWLKGRKVGDEVAVIYRGQTTTIETIADADTHYFIVGGSWFSRRTGLAKYSSVWYHSRIAEVTPAIRAEVALATKHRRLNDAVARLSDTLRHARLDDVEMDRLIAALEATTSTPGPA